ncbi:MAG TPA: hypothetical protein DDZ68_05995 [Parvularcula sp.]|nr:hypothetical protein [Parvularcula sp.]
MTGRDALAVCLLAALAGGCARKVAEVPRFALDQCARVTLVDETTGAAITGAEDLDIDRKVGRIFISAYDRRSAEAAAARRDKIMPQGGVYAIDIAALASGAASFKLRSLVDPSMIKGGLRPHGIAFDPASGELAFINRGYAAEGKAWRRQIDLITVDPDRPLEAKAARADCAANDVTAKDGRWALTLDHGGCGWRAALEDITGARGGRVIDAAGDEILSGLGFANGAVTAADGTIVVAATRERTLRVIDGEAGATLVKLNAAPDNLTLSDDGRIVAAVHPNLLSLGAQRKLGLGRSPSRVVEIGLPGGEQRLLFDDPKNALISAATVAIRTADLLVIGSVIDAGLVVCRERPASP